MRPKTIDQKYYDQAERNGIKRETFRQRVKKYQWSPEEASTTPAKLTSERFRKRVEKIQKEAAGKVPVLKWSQEEIDAHLANIGPDKNFDSYHKHKSAKTAITAPREKQNGHYFKPGEAW